MEIKKKTKMEKVKKNKDMKEKVGQKQGFTIFYCYTINYVIA